MVREYHEQVGHAIAKNLRDFGYSDLTDGFAHDVCLDIVSAGLTQKEAQKQYGIIGMMSRSQLVQNGYIVED